jgi:hypothetical protein
VNTNKDILKDGPLNMDNLPNNLKDPFSLNDFNLNENINLNNKLDNYLKNTLY